MIKGLDNYFISRFLETSIREHPAGFAAGAFSRMPDIGNQLPAIDRFLRETAGRCVAFRFHLTWKDSHRFSPSDFSDIVKEAKRIVPVILKNPKVKFYVSPACEYQGLTAAQATTLMKQVKAVLPANVDVVSSSADGIILPDFVNEFHGNKSRPKGVRYIMSFDSNYAGAEDSDIESVFKTFAKAEIIFIWTPRDNGRWETSDNTKRKDRTDPRRYPDSRLIDSLIYIAIHEKGETSLPPKYTYKSHSENKGVNAQTGKMDPRAEMPVLICPPKVSSISLKAANGQTIAVAKRYRDPYNDGRWRYYFEDWGYLLALKSIRINGSEGCELWVNGKKVGKLNPAFRDGDFR